MKPKPLSRIALAVSVATVVAVAALPAQSAAPAASMDIGFGASLSGDTDCASASLVNFNRSVPGNGTTVVGRINKSATVAATADPTDTVRGSIKGRVTGTVTNRKKRFQSLSVAFSAKANRTAAIKSGSACENTSVKVLGGGFAQFTLRSTGRLTARISGTATGYSSCSAYLNGPATWASVIGSGIVMRAPSASATIRAPKGTYNFQLYCSPMASVSDPVSTTDVVATISVGVR